jgi:4-hydroxy-tetrahydrodipicolinate synthase
MLPNGVFAAALTPLRDDLSIDHETFAEHCRWLLANGCNGVAPMGTTGEANSFSVAERIEALDRLIDAGLPPDKLLIGVGCCAIPDTVALTRHALALGVVSVLALPPFYYKNVNDDGVYAAFDQVIQRVGDARLQLYLYHFPQMSSVPIALTVLERLIKRYPNTVVGMKDSSGDWNNMKTIGERFPGFRLYAGTERYLLDILRAGGVGCISATTNVTCQLTGQVFATWQSHEVEALQRHLTSVRDAIEKYPAIAALKFLTAERSGRESWLNLRPPLRRLGDDRITALKAELARVSFVN